MKLFFVFFAMTLLFFSFGCDSKVQNVTQATISSEKAKTVSDDFSTEDSSWKQWSGKWIFTRGVLHQSATAEYYPLILRQDKQYGDTDISVDFKPISGRIDASGGLVFRAVDEKNYYIVRANALEDNFRLYTFKKGYRRQIASAKVLVPELGKIHQIRVVVQGDHIQAYLDGTLYLDHHDTSFAEGYVGLWTKADSVTEFDNLQITGVAAE